MGDSETESINWYDSLPDKEDEREGAVSQVGGGQGRAGQVCRKQARLQDREYVQIQSGWRWCSSCCPSCRCGSRVPSQAPLATAPSQALPEARCRDGERGSQRGSEEKRRMSQAGPEKKRIKAMCEPSLGSGKALPRPWSSMAAGTSSKQSVGRGRGQPLPKSTPLHTHLQPAGKDTQAGSHTCRRTDLGGGEAYSQKGNSITSFSHLFL